MTVKVEEATRQQVAVFVPEAIQKAVESYYHFMDLEIESTAKKFAEHHSAGKVAVAHIQLLLKLAQWADVKSGIDEGTIQALLQKARTEAGDYQDHDDPMDE
jgi:hypothetical protein